MAIHKGDSCSELGNYRPVSLTSVLCKALERIIRGHVCLHLTQHSMLCLRLTRFLETNLLCFLDGVTRGPDEGRPVKVCYLGFSRRFDSVNHRFLLLKLQLSGIGGRLLKWVGKFLNGRTSYVRVREASLDTRMTNSIKSE